MVQTRRAARAAAEAKAAEEAKAVAETGTEAKAMTTEKDANMTEALMDIKADESNPILKASSVNIDANTFLQNEPENENESLATNINDNDDDPLALSQPKVNDNSIGKASTLSVRANLTKDEKETTALIDNDDGDDGEEVNPTIQKEEKQDIHYVNRYLQLSHVLALVAITITVHAASYLPHNPLPYHAFALLLCIIPVRAIVALNSRCATLNRKGITNAVNAPLVFTSNAVHLLASRADPSLLLILLMASAMQVAAAWVYMTASYLRSPTQHFTSIRSFVDSSADIYLAAIIANHPKGIQWGLPFFYLRIAWDFIRTISSFLVIVSRDELEKCKPDQVKNKQT